MAESGEGRIPVFPARVEQLTPEILGPILAARRPGVEVEAVEVVSVKRCGEGIASTADRLVLDVTYHADASGGLPSRMVLKTMLASPHAPEAMYENEVRFYGEIRDELHIETPAVFGAQFDRGSGQFGVLLEDLTERGARFPAATTEVTLEEVQSILDQLAALHARFWESPRFSTGLAWIPTPTSGGMFEVFDAIGLELIQDQVARHPFKAELIAPLGRSLEEMWEMLWRIQRLHTETPTTLLHGDPHVGNTYLLPGGNGGLLDWQLMARGSWAHDVTYLLVTALDTETRRDHQRDLLVGYLDQLSRLGVSPAPSAEEAFERCRRAALWGLVIGWLITPPANYGPEITIANLGRTVAAVQDLHTFDAIG